MEDRSLKEASDETERTGGTPLDSPREVIDFARQYFSTAFPNQERHGCPAPEELRAQVREGGLAGEALRAHMFGCSECFGEYRKALAEMRFVAPVRQRASWRDALATLSGRRLKPIFISGMAAVLMIVIGAYVWREYSRAPEPSTAGEEAASQARVAAPAEEGLRDAATPEVTAELQKQPSQQPPADRRRQPRRPRSSEMIARAEIRSAEIDLEEYTQLRGAEGAGDRTLESDRQPPKMIPRRPLAKAIRLARAHTRLSLRLAEGGAKGLYRVDILNADGQPLITRKARSADGQWLTVDLDLRVLKADRYRLRLSREGELPEEYPLFVGKYRASSSRR